MTEPIKLPPLPEWTDWPSTVADMSVSEIKEAMQAFATAAIEADRQARGEPVTLEAERLAANRYRPVPDGVFAYKVVAGDGRRSLFSGSKDECYVVARKLTEAFLDGAFAATNAAPQPTESSRGEPVAWENFPGYLIDHCEGEIITEEGLQRALADMLADPRYSTQQKVGERSDTYDENDTSDPSGYAYRYRHFNGGTVLRFNRGEEVNGSKPIEAVPFWFKPQPQQTLEGDREILRDFFAALDKANALDKSSSAWVNRPKGSFGDRLQAWAEVNRLRAMLEAAPEPGGSDHG